MNPRSWYTYAIAALSGLALVAAGYFIWTRRAALANSLSSGSTKAEGAARSVWGRIERSANKLGHTERDPQAQE